MEKFKQWLSCPQVWGFLVSIAVMAAVSLAFFYPENFEGRSLQQADMQQGAANGHEAQQYYEATGEKALWTDALFGGMPTFQISPTYPSNRLFTWLNSVYGLGLPAPSNLLFMMMLGFLILLYAMDMKWYYALIGSIAWGLSTYYIIIIGAGHIWKFVTLTYIPPTIAGLVLTYRGRYVTGAALTALFAMLQLNANHPQMSYYFGLVMVAMVIAWGIDAWRSHTLRRWAIASAITLGAGALAVGANLPSLYNTYEYSKETKRAQSELTPIKAPGYDETDEVSDRPTGGMPRKDIVNWSYGRTETLSLLVPNIKGGATARPQGGHMVHMGLDKLDAAADYANAPVAQLLPYMPQYFNASEGTNGPVYVGAGVLLLFLIGCFVVRGPMKWALVIMTVLSVLLAWGYNFNWFTDLFIYHFPLYNKFRAVESILVIAEFTIPLLAIMALVRIISDPSSISLRVCGIVTGVCVVICLVAWLAPSTFGNAITPQDRQYGAQLADQITNIAVYQGYSEAEAVQVGQYYSLANPENVEAIETLRYSLVSRDGLRSLLFVLIMAVALFGYMRKWWNARVAIVVAGLSILVDLYTVDKRYLASDSFAPATATACEPFTPDAIDQLILRDTTHYRVMDVPGFTKPDRSYFHKTVGGYHAAKLNRYEDLLQRRLYDVMAYGYNPELRIDSVAATYADPESRMIVDRLRAAYRILDMLNARYIITGDESAPVLYNTSALGAAWLVDSISYVDNADREMEALTTLNPATEAVADVKFANVLGNPGGSLSPGDSISIISYMPNRVVYHAVTRTNAIGVFSEIWFPWGWKATIDGNPAPLGRVNYVLRAMAIPVGSHDIVMTFDPDSLHITGSIAYASVSIIYLLVLGALLFVWIHRATPAKPE